MESEMIEIGNIGNYYGCLWVTNFEGKYYWLIENFDTNFKDPEEWEEIPESLYNELMNFENN